MTAVVPLTEEQMDKAMRRIGELIKDRDAWRETARKSADKILRYRLFFGDLDQKGENE